MKAKSPSGKRRKPTAYCADRGDSLSLQELQAKLLKTITDMNLRRGAADSAEASGHKHLSRAEAKGVAEKMFAGLKFNQESVDEDSK